MLSEADLKAAVVALNEKIVKLATAAGQAVADAEANVASNISALASKVTATVKELQEKAAAEISATQAKAAADITAVQTAATSSITSVQNKATSDATALQNAHAEEVAALQKAKNDAVRASQEQHTLDTTAATTELSETTKAYADAIADRVSQENAAKLVDLGIARSKAIQALQNLPTTTPKDPAAAAAADARQRLAQEAVDRTTADYNNALGAIKTEHLVPIATGGK